MYVFIIFIFLIFILYKLNNRKINMSDYDRRWNISCKDLKNLNLCNKGINKKEFVSDICPKSCNICNYYKDYNYELNRDWGKYINPYEEINCNTVKYNNGGCKNWLKKYCMKTCCNDTNEVYKKWKLNCRKMSNMKLCKKKINLILL
tara:strand:+ start:384 stop:824 length:441 start_codon:yes stop_codon:yes gene_type:complete